MTGIIQANPPEEGMVTAEIVAKTIGGITTVGHARSMLQEAGWVATIVANRITVDRAVEAQLVSVNGKSWWNVYAVDGTPPVWTIGATTQEANWLGAIE